MPTKMITTSAMPTFTKRVNPPPRFGVFHVFRILTVAHVISRRPVTLRTPGAQEHAPHGRLL